MAFFENITNEWEQANGYQVIREFAAIKNTVTSLVYVTHDGQDIGRFDAPISEAASIEARAFIADDYNRRLAAEADAQAEIDAMLGNVPGALGYNEARYLNETRELGAALLSMTDAQMEATARNIVQGAGRGQPWAEALARLEQVRAAARQRVDQAKAEIKTELATMFGEAGTVPIPTADDLAAQFAKAANQSSAEVDALAAGLHLAGKSQHMATRTDSPASVKMQKDGHYLRAHCPYCPGDAKIGFEARFWPINGSGRWKVTHACRHAVGIMVDDPASDGWDTVDFYNVIEPAQPQQQGQWVALTAWRGDVCTADCPYCAGDQLNICKGSQGWWVRSACEHAALIDLGIMQAEFANPGPARDGRNHHAAVKILPKQKPPFEQACDLAAEMGLEFDKRDASLSGLTAGEYQEAIGAASAAGYDQPGHISDMSEAQFIAAVNAIASSRNVMAAFSRMNASSPISPPAPSAIQQARNLADELKLTHEKDSSGWDLDNLTPEQWNVAYIAASGKGWELGHDWLFGLTDDQFIAAVRAIADLSKPATD